MPQDWFAQNAPKKVEGDWFAQNAPGKVDLTEQNAAIEKMKSSDEPKLSRFGKSFYGMTPLPLLEPPKTSGESTVSNIFGAPMLAATRTVLGGASMLGQLPDAMKYWSARIPTLGEVGQLHPAKIPYSQTLQELGSIWPELAGMITGGVATAVVAGEISHKISPSAAERAAFVPKGLKKIGKGTGIPYSPTAVSAAERIGTLAPSGASRESLLAARDLDIAKGDLAEIARKLPATAVKGPEGTLARALKVVDHMDKLWEESHKSPIERHAELPIDNKAVLEEIQEGIPQEAIDNAPAEAKAASAWATRNFLEPRTVASADRLLRDINADLKSPAAQTAYGPLLLRTKQLAAGVLRDQIDSTLERAGEVGVKSANRRWGALRTVAQRMTESALDEAEKAGNTSLYQRLARTYMYVNPRSVIPHGGISVTPGKLFARAPSVNISKGMGLLGRSGIGPEVPVKPPGVLPPLPELKSAGPDVSFKERIQARPPIKTSFEAAKPGAEPVKAEAAPEVTPDRYAQPKEHLAYMRNLNSAITKLSRGSKKSLTDQEFAWIEKQTGLDLSDPKNLPAARKALLDLRKELMKPTGPIPQPGSTP